MLLNNNSHSPNALKEGHYPLVPFFIFPKQQKIVSLHFQPANRLNALFRISACQINTETLTHRK